MAQGVRLKSGRSGGIRKDERGMVLWIPADTVVLFFLRVVRVNLSSLRRAGKSCIVERALMKAISSCLSVVHQQELLYTAKTLVSRSAGKQSGEQVLTFPVLTSQLTNIH
jgi:hypothetical protein